MRKIGYARVCTNTQNLDRQIGAVRAERCHEVYREKASGKAVKGRPQLENVAEWDRATRSMMDGVHTIDVSTHGAP
jgi:resolvase-like protein